MSGPEKKPMKEPTFREGLIWSALPLLAAIVIAAIAALLYYLFWFGVEGLTHRFHD